MTHDDETRAAWLNLLGSGLDEGEPLHESLAHLHDRAEASHPKASTSLPLTLDRADALQLMTRASLPTVWRALVGTGDGTDWYWCRDHRPAVSVREVPVSEIHPSVTVQCTHCGVTVR